ncbi:MAG TPA: GNAT family N-acetyltransferase [Candidatus Elarobacter sp.]|jgi:RimJ/RimL family protein N-acetyltransferase
MDSSERPDFVVRTKRLRLIPATLQTLAAEEHARDRLSVLLGADVPADWPPPLNDDESLQFFISRLTAEPDAIGWVAWYFVRDEPGVPPVVIGNGGFKGQPSDDGVVEVGYSLFPQFQRRGYATEAVGELIDWAFGDERVRTVIAETLPDSAASMALLRRLGFTQTTVASEPGVIRFERRR